MAMSKKDYERAALIVQGMRRDAASKLPQEGGVLSQFHADGAQYGFIQLFAGENPRFDEARFCAACVPGANVKARPKQA